MNLNAVLLTKQATVEQKSQR